MFIFFQYSILSLSVSSYLISLCQAIRLSSISLQLLLAISLVYVRPLGLAPSHRDCKPFQACFPSKPLKDFQWPPVASKTLQKPKKKLLKTFFLSKSSQISKIRFHMASKKFPMTFQRPPVASTTLQKPLKDSRSHYLVKSIFLFQNPLKYLKYCLTWPETISKDFQSLLWPLKLFGTLRNSLNYSRRSQLSSTGFPGPFQRLHVASKNS